jgi:hypothetical protein
MRQICRSGRCCRHAGPGTAAQAGPIALEKKIAGVCAGVARYFDADVTPVRVV